MTPEIGGIAPKKTIIGCHLTSIRPRINIEVLPLKVLIPHPHPLLPHHLFLVPALCLLRPAKEERLLIFNTAWEKR